MVIKGLKFFIVIVGCFFAFTTFSFAADAAKIGIVDIQKVIDISNPGKKAQAELNAQGTKMFDDIKVKGAEIEKMKAQVEKESLSKPKDKREEDENKLKDKLNAFRDLQKKYNEDVKALNQKLLTKVQEDVLKIIGDMGKKEGYLIILEKREAGVLYTPATVDLTDDVIKKYNAKG